MSTAPPASNSISSALAAPDLAAGQKIKERTNKVVGTDFGRPAAYDGRGHQGTRARRSRRCLGDQSSGCRHRIPGKRLNPRSKLIHSQPHSTGSTCDWRPRMNCTTATCPGPKARSGREDLGTLSRPHPQSPEPADGVVYRDPDFIRDRAKPPRHVFRRQRRALSGSGHAIAQPSQGFAGVAGDFAKWVR